MTAAEIVASKAITIDYTNHRGERATRRIVPVYLWWGFTDWHPTEGWLLHAFDLDKQAYRDFAWSGIHGQHEALLSSTGITPHDPPPHRAGMPPAARVYAIRAGEQFQPRVTVLHQTFNVGYAGTQEEADFMVRMVRTALERAGARVLPDAGMPPDEQHPTG